MKVVFVVEYPFNQRDYNRFGVQLLLEQGLDVEVWDFSPFLATRQFANYQVTDPVAFAGHKIFHSEQSALTAIAGASDVTAALLFMGVSRQRRAIYQGFSRQPIVYGVEQLNALPTVVNSEPFIQRVLRVGRSPQRLIAALAARLPGQQAGIRPVDFYLAGGANSVSRAYPLGPNTHLIWAHTLDYDLYLKEEQQQGTPPATEYAVFLDEFWPFHPEFAHMGLPCPVTADRYYPLLNDFFDCLEAALQCPVVIAAHPRSDYESRPDYFRGRQVVKGRTLQLVKHARVVMTHDSTSVNFANLYNKPVVFLGFNLDPIYQDLIIVERIAAEFGKRPINLETAYRVDWSRELQIDQAAYARYRNAYIKKTGSPEKPCWQIFADYVKTLPMSSRRE